MISQTTDPKVSAALLESQRRVLERIATGASLEDVLDTLVRLIEEQAGEMRCVVTLVDAAQERLRIVAAPNIPEDFKASIECYLRIAPDMCPCGTAVYLRSPVYTRDIATEATWRQYRQLALRNGLRAIWSMPIVSDGNAVLGTFAMFYGEPRLPSEEHIALIDVATQMARIAIEAKRDDDILRTVFDGAPAGMVITDIKGKIVRVNQAFASALGYPADELQGMAISSIAEYDGDGDLREELPGDDGEAAGHTRYRTRNGSSLWARERSALRRGPNGDPSYVLTYIDALGDAPDATLRALSAREMEVLRSVVAGKTSKEIAAQLRISPASVDTYRSRIMLKLSIDDVPALVRFAIRHGIVRL